MYKPVVLVIMDGVGLSPEKKGNALAIANLPNLTAISEKYPGARLHAASVEVGVPWGEVGSSEVGHTNIGAGLVVYQNLPRVSFAIKDGSFFQLTAWQKAIDHAEKYQSAINIMGLASNGGIHSHVDHLLALLELLAKKEFRGEVYLHLFTDGEDAPVKSAPIFIKQIEAKIQETGVGKIATLIGRNYAMDRTQNWPNTKAAYECLTFGVGNKFASAEAALSHAYGKKLNDEWLEPSVITDGDRPIGLVQDNDAVIFFNFRPDRARQLTEAFTAPDFKGFPRRKIPNLLFITMTRYHESQPTEVAFEPQRIAEPLAKVVADAGKKQFHIAETEKYAHATYFLNGGREEPFAGEDRAIIPSLKVESYAKKPEMSAGEITDRLIKEIESGQYDFIAANFANGDMIGHTGDLNAAVKAVEVLDENIGRLQKAVMAAGGAMIITADHGNCESMINLETGQADPEHTTNPVPFWLITPKPPKLAKKAPPTEAVLADVAPTVLELMGLTKPSAMTAESLASIVSYQPLQ